MDTLHGRTLLAACLLCVDSALANFSHLRSFHGIILRSGRYYGTEPMSMIREIDRLSLKQPDLRTMIPRYIGLKAVNTIRNGPFSARNSRRQDRCMNK